MWRFGGWGGTLALCALGVPFRPGRSWVAHPWRRGRVCFELGGGLRPVRWGAKPHAAGERSYWLSGRRVGAARGWGPCLKGWTRWGHAGALAPDTGSCSEAQGKSRRGRAPPSARSRRNRLADGAVGLPERGQSQEVTAPRSGPALRPWDDSDPGRMATVSLVICSALIHLPSLRHC